MTCPPRRLAAALLFGLLVAPTVGWGETPPASDTPSAELASSARRVLRTHCFRCHGEEGAAEGGFADALSHRGLVESEKIVPGDPAASLLWQRVTDESAPMPPEEEPARPSADELASLRRWIEAGAPPFDDAPARPFAPPTEDVAAAHADLAAAPAGERRSRRYFSLTHLRNAGASDRELESHRRALAKLLNSLSWRPEIALPAPTEKLDTLLRIDLRDYGWDAADWDEATFRVPARALVGTPAEAEAQAWTGASLPWFPADAFVFAASQPPLYHLLLDLPATDTELERLLHVDVEADVAQGAARRGGFASSGVSRHNRMIERHASSYGAYWKSYDFARSSGRKSLFAHPLGPGDSVREFEHDGGEIIFNLPNGLQAYLLIDAAGRRIDRGPIDIVSDPKRADRQVVNGVSCMTCHAGGMIPKRDEVRPHVLGAPAGFRAEEVSAVRALYAPHEEMERLYEQDSKRHRDAVRKTGAPLTETEPVAALARLYERDLDLARVAAELGTTPEAFLAKLDKTPTLARVAGALREPGGRIKRDAMLRQVAPLRHLFGLQTLERSRRQVVGLTPFEATPTPLVLNYRFNVVFHKHPEKPGLRLPVWRYFDEANRLWIYVTPSGGMAVVPRGVDEPESAFKIDYFATQRIYKEPSSLGGPKPPLEPVMILAFRDSRAGAAVYLSDTGGIAAFKAPALARPLEKFEDPTATVRQVHTRGPGEPYLHPSLPQVFLETVRDPNRNQDFVFSSRGGIALASFPAGEFGVASTHAYDLAARPAATERFGEQARRVAVELHAQPGSVLAITDLAGLAGALTDARDQPTAPPVWKRGHVVGVPIDHPIGSVPPAGERLGIEVYEDPNTGLLLYVNDRGGVTLASPPAGG